METIAFLFIIVFSGSSVIVAMIKLLRLNGVSYFRIPYLYR